MDIHELAKTVPFGQSLTPYQSKSAGTDFEDILLQVKSELENAQAMYTRNLLSPSSLSSKARYSAEASLFGSSSLFSMESEDFSLLEDLLFMALEESRLASENAEIEASTGETTPYSLVDDRYKMDGAKIGAAIRRII